MSAITLDRVDEVVKRHLDYQSWIQQLILETIQNETAEKKLEYYYQIPAWTYQIAKNDGIFEDQKLFQYFEKALKKDAQKYLDAHQIDDQKPSDLSDDDVFANAFQFRAEQIVKDELKANGLAFHFSIDTNTLGYLIKILK
ncbi:hypothetical protein WR164_14760 [Philodulcilactobacillus myokoensis]|uniref:Uncharacterized protein n=1 Tax=Philodulcilactobacillus myokoensis TaxID=2929573 RepID=A0A9W6ETM3_9LACO|nr:hypothetical protein [Philodulcilactobacillus myokoensis]GLB47497.1 hypothetical protein WR164_14760 [Philodulcilactobacillus myokoensis]